MIILTGSQGFIGKNFLKKLNTEVIEVEKENAYEFIRKFDKWDQVSLILHQGAISHTTEKNIQTLHHHNVVFSLYLFAKAIEYGIPVKYASSASVYGNQDKIINPLNYYAMSKATVDYWVQDNIDRFRHIQGFRYFNVYGTGEYHKRDQASLVSKFTWQSATGVIHPFAGSDRVVRDYVWVGDIVNVVLTNNAGSGIFDLGTGSPISIQEVADLVAKKERVEIQKIPFPPHLEGKYQYYTCADMSWLTGYKFKTVGDYLNRQGEL